MPRYAYRRFPYATPPELRGAAGRRWPVVVVGAGPVGLAAAVDLALHGVEVLVLDDNDVVSVGSRAICWSKRTLEIMDRLGVGERMLAKGVTWKVGRVFHRDRELYSFDLLPEAGHKMPAFVNLQQYYVEEYLVDRCRELSDRIELRWKSRVAGISQNGDRVRLAVATPDGPYTVDADYVLACDGVRSSVRQLMGLDFAGQVFEERFLIADVVMAAEFPSERWFWFEPPFHEGQSALLHKQPDDLYRIDLQLGWEADPEAERRPERVTPRIRAMIGERPFELDWVSVYTFQCRRMERFVHGRVIFAGDSAHVVSPFGARGGNGGIQDVDNLCWKLAAVLRGDAPERLLASYDEERIRAAEENLLNSARATSFMTPKGPIERLFRDAVLELAEEHAFARRLVNSGRLSRPHHLGGLSLQTPVMEAAAPMAPGAPCDDAPVATPDGRRWLLELLRGGFHLLHRPGARPPRPVDGVPMLVLGRDFQDPDGLVTRRYALTPGATVLIRPDQHVAARWPEPDPAAIRAALARATASLPS
jgi:3-(3-hydroxy-phenyl)propionate hydroxylase